MYRLLSVFALILGLVPLQARALALGDIELHSALNQPLDAQVELLSLGDTELEDIDVQLASPEDFDRVGLERPFFLTGLRFRLAEKDGTPYLYITTRDPLREPFIDFLVSVKWPNGRLLREYTLLLDPPVFLEDKPAPVQAPQAAAPVAPVQRQAPQSAPGRMRAAAPRLAPTGNGLSYGPVTRNDTLWSIARQMRPDNSVTVPQVMMALLKNNPEAFYHGNVNYLKAGYVLRLPEPAAIAGIDPREAEREIMLQNQQWEDARRQRAGNALRRPAGPQEGAVPQEGAARDGNAPVTAASRPRLRLVVPEGEVGEQALEGVSDKTEAGAAATAELDALRRELALAMETSEASRQENAELRQRLATLEEQINKMQRLLSLRDDTLAALQGGAVKSGGDAVETDTAAPAMPEKGEEKAAQAAGAAAAAAATTAPARPVSPSGGGTSAPRETPPPDSIDQLLADPMLMGAAGGAALLVLALAWMVVRRRRQASEEVGFQDAIAEQAEEAAAEAEDASGAAGEAVAGGETTGEEHSGEAADAAVSDTGEGLGLDVFQAEEDEIDTLAEADVYLAYRRFDKAEELLKEAIAQEPHRHDYVLKLLEVYATCENREAFLVQAEALHSSLDGEGGELWDKVVSMGRQLLPEHPWFGGVADEEGRAEAGDEAGATAEAAGGDDVDDEAAQVQAAYAALHETQPLEPVLPGDEGDSSLAGTSPGEEERAGGADADSSPLEASAELDLDLDLDALQSETEDTEGGAQSERLSEDAGGGPSLGGEATLSDGEPSPLGEARSGEASDVAVSDGGEGMEETAGTPAFPEGEQADSTREEESEGEETASSSTGGDSLESDIDWLAKLGDDEEGLDLSFDVGEESEEMESDLISGEDEVSTKLDLARAYIDMGDQESARSILDEVITEGNEDQKDEAQALIRQIG